MANSTESAEKAEAQTKERRAKQAAIVAGLQIALQTDEQLLGFARGKIAGGWRGKFAIGLEAFFAPDVNVGLTERHFLLQHIHATSGTPSEIMPHRFPLADIAAIMFSDIETFGGEPAGRLVMKLQDEQHFRVKLSGALNCEDAVALTEVFRSLTSARRASGLSPTQSTCPHCGHTLDRPTKFCPYCGKIVAAEASPAPDFHAEFVPADSATESPVSESAESEASFADVGAVASDLTPSPYTAFTAPVTPPILPDFSEPEAPLESAEAGEEAPDETLSPELAGTHTEQEETAETVKTASEIPVILSQETATAETLAAFSQSPAAPPAFEAASASDTQQLAMETPVDIPFIVPSELHESETPEAQTAAAPSASTAFWREFARISGVATPEVFAPHPKPENVNESASGEVKPEDAAKPAFPLSQEENE